MRLGIQGIRDWKKRLGLQRIFKKRKGNERLLKSILSTSQDVVEANGRSVM